MSRIFAQDYFVAPPPAGNDINPGTSWTTPFATIQKGIDTASAGQIVAVSNGTYTLTTQINLNKGITLLGISGAGVTIIDGNLSSPGTFRCLSITDVGAILDGFTITRSRLQIHLGSGAGIYMTGGIVRNCIITNCVSYYQEGVGGGAQGGGISMTAGRMESTSIRNCRALGWNTPGQGGAVYMTGGTVSNVTVISCVATSGGGGAAAEGAGIWCGGGIIQNSSIVSNQCNSGSDGNNLGGGIRMSAGQISDCLIAYNYCERGRGGGLYLSGGTNLNGWIRNNRTNHRSMVGGLAMGGGVYLTGGTLYGTEVTSNSCSTGWTIGDGGGIYMNGAAARVINCIVAHNYANAAGGGSEGRGSGIYTGNGLVRGCLIAANGNASGKYGGGIYMAGGQLESCTIVHNQAATTHGGIYRNTGTVLNTIIWSNTAPATANISLHTNVTYCCSPGLTNGSGNITANPRLVEWASGFGWTAAGGDFHLARNSPAFGTGIYQDWMVSALDLDGNCRITGTVVDIGADEFFFAAGTVLCIR